MEQQRPRNANGTFQKGQPAPLQARKAKGTQNKITRDIREGAIEGFARHGSNGRGEGGFAGFCYYLAKKHPKAAAKIVEKLLPLQVNAKGIGSPSINAVNIVSIPTNHFLSHDDIQRLKFPVLEQEVIAPPPGIPVENAEPLPPEDDLEFVSRTETEQQLRAQLESLGEERLRELAKQVGCDVDSG